jgi:hypothetical protein
MKSRLRAATFFLMLLAPAFACSQNPVTVAAATESGAVVTSNGLAHRSLKDGSGASPTPVDRA